jgi:hypothetical protein
MEIFTAFETNLIKKLTTPPAPAPPPKKKHFLACIIIYFLALIFHVHLITVKIMYARK